MTHNTLRRGLISAITTLLALSSATAEEPRGVKLMRPDCLAGWEYGAEAPRGWTLAEGRLGGSAESTPLLSGLAAGEGRLSFRWSVAEGGRWRILLPEVPRGEGLELHLGEGPGGGRLTDGPRVLHPGAPIEPVADGSHTAVLCREGGSLSVTIDGRRLYEVPLPAQRRFGLGLALAAGKGSIWDLRGEEPLGEPLFNGKDLDDWWCDGSRSAWSVEDGQIVLQPGGGNYLRTKKEFGNFTLSLEYRMRPGGNSGLGIRTPRQGWPSGDGMEIQFLDQRSGEHLDEQATASIYGNVPPLARADRSDQWNRVVIKAEGWMIWVWMNGELVQQFNTLDHPELKHRRLSGWIGPQDHGAAIRVRDVRLLPAPEGTGLDVWLRPRPVTAAKLMADHLMNTESLARVDGVRSGVVSRSIAAEKPLRHVLAELTGPGAVVRIARSNDEGRLSFYFDGQKESAIACKPTVLWQKVPPLNEDSRPVLTYLPYEKSLSIVLEGARQADYRIDYVTFPKELPVETFSGPYTTIPRGWLSAPMYRQHVIRFGVHRECDPAPRIRPEPKTIAPGKTEALARVEGAGLVRWVKLRAETGALAGDDLWLEVTVDGEPTPAIAAPARFWFPGLVEGGNYYNYLLVERNGLANLLAMPFGDGITISATNRGSKPLESIGAELSFEPATEANRAAILARLRLRGVFEKAGPAAEGLFHFEGHGRWVGLVLASPGGQTPGITKLVVDGQEADGWAAPSLEGFLGSPEPEFRRSASGHAGGMAWRYLLLAPVNFQRSIALESSSPSLPERLALFYVEK